MGPAHVFDFSLDRGPWFLTLLRRGKAVPLQSRTGNQLYRGLQGTMIMGVCPSMNGSVCFTPLCKQPTYAADPAVYQHHRLQLGSRPAHCDSSAETQPSLTLRLLMSDLAMLLCQLLLFINHLRRLMDVDCPFSPSSAAAISTDASPGHVPGGNLLGSYPCGTSVSTRVAFLITRVGSTFRAAFQLPLGELWVPLVTTAILTQLLALLLMPHRFYMAFGRRTCMVLVGLLPKAVSLATFLALPGERPSSYFYTYLPIEGAITLWQHVVYNCPFWQGIAVLAAHCTLSTFICITVAPRMQSGEPQQPLFNAAWVLVQTYCCAALAAYVALQQHPTAVWEFRIALRAAATAVDRSIARLLRGALHSLGSAHRAEELQMRGNGSVALTAGGRGVAAAATDLQLRLAMRRILDDQAFGSSAGTCSSLSWSATSSSVGSSQAPSKSGSATARGSSAAIAQAVAYKAAASSTPGRGEVFRTMQTARTGSALPYERGVPGFPVAKVLASTAPGGRVSEMPMGPELEASAVVPKGPNVSYAASTHGRGAMVAAATPLTGAFSLKQPTGLSKWTIVEDQEFQAPAAVGVGVSMDVIGHISAHSRRFKRYNSRAPPQRVHMKIPWAEPDQLPGNFLERLNLALSEGLDCMAVGVSVRAGCIELVFDLVPQAAFDSASDYRPGQSRHRHVQQQHAPGSMTPRTDTEAAELPPRHGPTRPHHQQQPHHHHLSRHQAGHLDLLVHVGAGRGSREGVGRDGSGGDDELDPDPHSALEAAVLSGLLADAEPSSWIEALHLQPPPGAEVLTQACGRVWISRWNHTLRQWVPERAGGIKPAQLPRITQLRPPCVLVHRRLPGSAAFGAQAEGAAGPGVEPWGPRRQSQGGGSEKAMLVVRPPMVRAAGGVVVRVTVSNVDGATPPAFSARCRGRYLPLVARLVRSSHSSSGAEGECGSEEQRGAPATFDLELEPEAMPRNGLVVLECKVGKLLSNWRPLIITEDPQLAEELASLQGPQHPAAAPPATAATAVTSDGNAVSCLDLKSCESAVSSAAAHAADAASDASCWDELHSDLGLWLDYLEVLGLSAAGRSRSSSASGGQAEDSTEETATAAVAVMPAAASRLADSLDLGPGLAALYTTEGYRAHMAGIGVSLLEFAVDQGWSHVAGMLVDQMLAAGIPWSEVLRRCSNGLTLLHRAVRSGRGEVVELVVRLGERHGTAFDWQAVSMLGDPEELDAAAAAAVGGGGGVTPLHLAASLPDGGRLAERILREYQAACKLWASAVEPQGLRPVDCARALGHLHLSKQAPGGPTERGGVAGAWAGGAPSRKLGAAATAAAELRPARAATTRSSKEMAVRMEDAGAESDGTARPRSSIAVAVATSSLTAVQSVMGTIVATLRAAAQLLAAPFVGDRRAEAAYVQAVGAEYVLWCCGYQVYQMCVVLAVAGRMVKELRVHEMGAMMLFAAPHVVSIALLCANYGAWLKLREPLCAVITILRTLAKLLPALGLLPYPASANNYLSGGMDVLLEGLLPAYFERMRAPFVLPLRALEGVATGLLYRSHHVVLRLAPAGVSEVAYALVWAFGCAAITVALDVRCRQRLAEVVGAYNAGGSAAGAAAGVGAGTGAAVGRLGRVSGISQGAVPAPVAAVAASDGSGAVLKQKKVD